MTQLPPMDCRSDVLERMASAEKRDGTDKNVLQQA